MLSCCRNMLVTLFKKIGSVESVDAKFFYFAAILQLLTAVFRGWMTIVEIQYIFGNKCEGF